MCYTCSQKKYIELPHWNNQCSIIWLHIVCLPLEWVNDSQLVHILPISVHRMVLLEGQSGYQFGKCQDKNHQWTSVAHNRDGIICRNHH